MDNIIKRSEIKKLKNIQFNIDSQFLEPEETVNYLTGLGYSEQQIDQLLTLVYWANDEENPNRNIDKLLENGWTIDNEDGTNTARIIPSTYSPKIGLRCMCCGERVLFDYTEGLKVQACLCDKCKAAILNMRKFLPEDKEIIAIGKVIEQNNEGDNVFYKYYPQIDRRDNDIVISVVPPLSIPTSEYYSWYVKCCRNANITFEQLSYAMQMHPYADTFIVREKENK